MEGTPGLDKFGQFVNRRELDALRPSLAEGERVLRLLEARHGRKGLLAATDRRLLFSTSGFFRRKALSWSYPDVVALKVLRAVDDATLTLTLRQGAVEFTGCRKADAEAFVEAVRRRPPPPDAPLDFTPPHLRPKDERTLRREKLDRMLQKGSITKSEHERMVRGLDE